MKTIINPGNVILCFLKCILFLSSFNLSAQTYSIPGASQQPQFVFPLYFEDGIGQRDTLYLGYDPSASVLSFAAQDSIFGVKRTLVDTTRFYMVWDSFSCGWGPCLDGYKVNVTNVNSFAGHPLFPQQTSFTGNKGVLPLKISWDSNLLYSDSLPFSFQVNSPKGQGMLYFNCNYCYCTENGIHIIDVYSLFSICDTMCELKNSAQINHGFGLPDPIAYGTFDFWIQEWTNGWGAGIPESSNEINKIKIIYFDNKIRIENNSSNEINFQISDILGRTSLSGEVEANGDVNIEAIQNLLLIIRIYNNKIYYYEKAYFTNSD